MSGPWQGVWARWSCSYETDGSRGDYVDSFVLGDGEAFACCVDEWIET